MMEDLRSTQEQQIEATASLAEVALRSVVPPITDWGPTHHRPEHPTYDITPEDLSYSA